jgi:hypothetical protein
MEPLGAFLASEFKLDANPDPPVDLDADPDSAFHSDADLASQNDASNDFYRNL